MKILIRYPLGLLPDEHRYYPDGVQVSGTAERLNLTFVAPGLTIRSDGDEPNVVRMGGRRRQGVRGLGYKADGSLRVPTRIEIGLVVYRHRLHRGRLCLLVLLVLLCTMPLVAIIWRDTMLAVQLTVGNLAVASIPVALLTVLGLTARRLHSTLESVLQKGVAIQMPVASYSAPIAVAVAVDRYLEDATVSIEWGSLPSSPGVGSHPKAEHTDPRRVGSVAR